MDNGSERARARRSVKRDAILKALLQSKSHPSAEHIYNLLKQELPDLSLGTVYRNLSLFREEGLSISVGVVKGQERFDGNVSPHSHLFCSCGAVVDIDGIGIDEELDIKASLLSGCEITGHEIVFHGLCPECKNKKERSGGN